MQPGAKTPSVGDVLGGRHELTERLGGGGMGEVFLARDVSTASTSGSKPVLVAIKLLKRPEEIDEFVSAQRKQRDPTLKKKEYDAFLAEMRARFRAESDVMAKLRGVEGVAQLISANHDDPTPFIVMERAPGRHLDDDGVTQDQAELHRFLERLLEVLVRVHERGVVHRDLKPSNILVDGDLRGDFKLTLIDFGIAKNLVAGRGLTHTHFGMGTPAYVAPEQAMDAKSVDARADIYSVGAIALALATGAALEHPSLVDDRLGALAPQYEGFVTWVKKAMAAKPDARFASADAMLQALRALREQSAKGHATIPPVRKMRVPTPPSPEPEPETQPAKTKPVDPVVSTKPVTQVPRPPRELADDRRGVLVGASALGVLALAIGAVVLLVVSRSDRPDPHPVEDRPNPEEDRPRPVGDRSRPAEVRPSPVQDRPPTPLPAPDGMVALPGGSFTMGSTAEQIRAARELCRADAQHPNEDCGEHVFARELPPRQVQVQPFFLDRTEVTNADFVRVMNAIPDVSIQPMRGCRVARLSGTGWFLLGECVVGRETLRSPLLGTPGHFSVTPGTGALPVVLVSWHAARAYCEHEGGRLPTEEEWEFAARGIQGRIFPWGAADPDEQGTVFGFTRGLAVVRGRADSRGQDHTPEGLQDLAGNVAEWTSSLYTRVSGEPDSEDLQDSRVVRGGGVHFGREMLRGAARGRTSAQRVEPTVGFRCARSR